MSIPRIEPQKWIVALLHHSKIQSISRNSQLRSFRPFLHFPTLHCKHQSHIISHQSLTPRCHLAVHWTELFVACHGFADVALTRLTFANLLATASRKSSRGITLQHVLKRSPLVFLDPKETFGMLISNMTRKSSCQVQPQRTLDSKRIMNVLMSKECPSLPIIPPV